MDDSVYLKKQHDCDTNAIKTLGLRSRITILGVPDMRPLITKISPNVGGLSYNIIATIKNKIIKGNGWTTLVGNTNNDRSYYPNLQKEDELYTYIKNAIDWYLSEVKNEYPALKIIKLGLIKSEPYAKSQYDGFSQKLHSDYPNDVNALDLAFRPVSFIIALDEFDFIYLPSQDATRGDIVTETIRPGQMILFSNNCLHAGGSNRHNKVSTRIFGYVCNKQSDIPVNQVWPHTWSSTNDNAVLVKDDGINNIVAESAHGRPLRRTKHFSP